MKTECNELILDILHYLKKNSCEKQPICVRKIANEIGYDRRTVGKALKVLNEKHLVGLSTKTKRDYYYYCADALFTSAEAKSLIDIIDDSDIENKKEIKNKILNQLSDSDKKSLEQTAVKKTTPLRVRLLCFGNDRDEARDKIKRTFENIRFSNNQYEARIENVQEDKLISFLLLNHSCVEIVEPVEMREKLRELSKNIRNLYLKKCDFYGAEIKRLENGSRKMHFENIDINNKDKHISFDVESVYLRNVKESDIRFLENKINLNTFVSIENKIQDYSCLVSAPNLSKLAIVFNKANFNIGFVSRCKNLTVLLIDSVRMIKDIENVYQALNLKYLLLFNAAGFDVERFLDLNPSTKVITSRKEAEKEFQIFEKTDIPLEEYKISDEDAEKMSDAERLLNLLDRYQDAKSRSRYST